ncbi:MAG: hypothetical protein CMP18_02115 [Rickettsiales bacterium]|jgi:voltage-gated potassium channel|nr:hypothetical protein [Rickettsiales bacterium]|tara:strand:+ start:4837 stop:5970 length:1134 start_codon:yes stop_codon:yes gene_type:complete
MIFRVRRNLRLQNVVSNEISAKSRLVTSLIILVLILILHSFAMVHFEEMAFRDALWLSLTSVTTVGYGDFSAQTNWGRLSTICLLYIIGIAILAQAATTYFDYKIEYRNRIQYGKLNWKMKNHIVFVNCPKETAENFFYQAITGLRKSFAAFSNLPVAIVSDSFNHGIPSRLQKLDVVYVNHKNLNDEAIKASCLLHAKIVVILSRNRFDSNSDSINFEITDRIRDLGFKGRIVAEVTHDENRQRLLKAGADNVLRPIRTYPEMLMRAILAPGSESIMETLFNSNGEECIRYDVDINIKWLDVIIRLASKNHGIPIAYLNQKDEIINNPPPTSRVHTKAIYVLVNEGKKKTDKQISTILHETTLKRIKSNVKKRIKK